MVTKTERYAALVERIKHAYETNAPSPNKKGVSLTWCEDCEEVNLWSYWQGKGNLDAKILLVGQDWGCPVPQSAVMQNIRAIKNGESVSYMTENESITDKNLIRLFSVLGYDITNDNPKNKELFFTNFVLGYRDRGLSGALSRDWVSHDKAYFQELINIIEPKIIICLGRATLCGVIESFGKREVIGNYNHFIESDKNPYTFMLKNGNAVKVYGVAHCGVMGTLNRNKKASSTDLGKQILDWERIAADISNAEQE